MTTYYMNDVMAYAQNKSEKRLRSLEQECDYFKLALESFVKRYSDENLINISYSVLSERISSWKNEVEDLYFDLIDDELNNGPEREAYQIYEDRYLDI